MWKSIPFQRPPTIIGIALARSLVVFVFAFVLASCNTQQAARPDQLAQLGKFCVAQMVANTCQAMKPGSATFSKPGDVVFVAGVGPVDAQLLDKLNAAGQSMCSEVQATCQSDWSGKPCSALKKMYAPELAK